MDNSENYSTDMVCEPYSKNEPAPLVDADFGDDPIWKNIIFPALDQQRTTVAEVADVMTIPMHKVLLRYFDYKAMQKRKHSPMRDWARPHRICWRHARRS